MSIHPPTAAAATASAMANLKAILMCPYALPCASRVAAIPLLARLSLPRSPFLPRRIVDLPSPPLYGKPGSTTSLSAAGRRLSIRAAHISDSGPINSPMMSSMEKKIKEQLNADEVCVRDAYGDGRHVSIDVIALAFEGQSAVNRQRMVYKAIWEELQSTVHAVDQMTTRTPTEAAATSQNS